MEVEKILDNASAPVSRDDVLFGLKQAEVAQ